MLWSLKTIERIIEKKGKLFFSMFNKLFAKMKWFEWYTLRLQTIVYGPQKNETTWNLVSEKWRNQIIHCSNIDSEYEIGLIPNKNGKFGISSNNEYEVRVWKCIEYVAPMSQRSDMHPMSQNKPRSHIKMRHIMNEILEWELKCLCKRSIKSNTLQLNRRSVVMRQANENRVNDQTERLNNAAARIYYIYKISQTHTHKNTLYSVLLTMNDHFKVICGHL